MSRFLLLAIPAFFLLLALAGFVADLFLPSGSFGPLALRHEGERRLAALWALETIGVVALYCLVRADRERPPSLWDGVLVAWGAWILRGPLLLLSLQAAGVTQPAMRTACAVLLGAYTVGGVALVGIDRRLSRPRQGLTPGSAPP